LVYQPVLDLFIDMPLPDQRRAPPAHAVARNVLTDDVDLDFLVGTDPLDEPALVEGDALHADLLQLRSSR
jgi:hypothetical protein